MKAKPKLCSFCGKLSVLWKSSPKTCHTCARKQATTEAIERSKGEHNHKGLTASEDGKEAKVFKYQTSEIKKVSTRQQQRLSVYNIAAKLFKKNNPVCKARIKCIGSPTTDVHHKKGRGEYLLDQSTWLPVCRACHIFIETSPEQAKALGFSESRLSKAI
jgi:hypothetical protein